MNRDDPKNLIVEDPDLGMAVKVTLAHDVESAHDVEGTTLLAHNVKKEEKRLRVETGSRFCAGKCGLIAHAIDDGWAVARLVKGKVKWPRGGYQAMPPDRCPLCTASLYMKNRRSLSV